MKKKLLFSLLFISSVFFIQAQNQTTKWIFGAYAGLDFMSGAPVGVFSPTMMAPENSSSIADSAGNLLFYTNSESIWDASHNIMANGSGILGNWSTIQSTIVKRPGSANEYYVFTIDDVGGPDGLRYSTVNMSLAAGMGSVTSKNNFIYAPFSEQVTATLHCNGTDVWVLAHDFAGNGFKAYLVTATGVNTVAVTSNAGMYYGVGSVYGSYLKFSPMATDLGWRWL